MNMGHVVASILRRAIDCVGVEPDTREEWVQADRVISTMRTLAIAMERGTITVQSTRRGDTTLAQMRIEFCEVPDADT